MLWFYVLIVFVLCHVYAGVQHILCCVFVCLSSCCILCMVVSNTYCVVYLFVCLRVVSCVWWYLTHIVLYICLFVFVLYLVYGGI